MNQAKHFTNKYNYSEEVLHLIDYCTQKSLLDEYKIIKEKKFNVLFLNKLYEENDTESCSIIKMIIFNYAKGLIQARKGKLKSAKNYFEKGNKYKSKLDRGQNFIVDALTLSNISYLKYKKGHYAEAINDLHSAIETTDVLIQAGYHFLHIHKLKQVQNLIRINFKISDAKSVMKLNNELLSYLINHKVPNWDVGNWNSQLLYKVPNSLIESMTFQVTDEMINYILFGSNLETSLLENQLKHAFKGLAQTNKLDLLFLPSQAIGHYLYLMDLYFEEKYELFIFSAKKFLAQAPLSCNVWKFILIDSLIKIVKKTATQAEFSKVKSTVNLFVSNYLITDKNKINQFIIANHFYD